MIYKLFFENISGLLRIFTNKNLNFKLTIIPIQNNNDKINKITYHFIKNILNFPNNIKQIFTEFLFLKKNLDNYFFYNKNLNFILQISDGHIVVSESIIAHYNDIINLNINNKNENYNSNKKNIIDNDDDDINDLLEFYIKNNKEDNCEDDFIFEIE